MDNAKTAVSKAKSQFLLVTRGLPASGKSTWALEQCKKDKKLVRVNRDQIRLMLGQKWNPKHEKLVTQIRDSSIKLALLSGRSVINDDTNLSEDRLADLRAIAGEYEVAFRINDSFLDVPVEECIKRDAGRQASVGKDVILKLYYQYWEGQPKPRNEGYRHAVLCDLDGTLCTIPNGANPYVRDFTQDLCNMAVAECLRSMNDTGYFIILMSGRDSKFRGQTEEWLSAYSIPYFSLHMREEGDVRKDDIVKKELYMKHVQGKDFHVAFVLDDRPQVVRMWRAELGLTVFHVAPDVEF